MYGRSYIRAVSLNNGGPYWKFSSNGSNTKTDAVATQSVSHTFAPFTMTNSNNYAGLANYIVQPKYVEWQRVQKSSELLDATGYDDDSNNEGLTNGTRGEIGTYTGITGYDGWGSDNLWITSRSETGCLGSGTNYPGLWKTNSNERSNSKETWQRTSPSNETKSAAALDTTAGKFLWPSANNSYAVRPAMHLNLSQIANYEVLYEHSGYKNMLGDKVGGFEGVGWQGNYDAKHVRNGKYALKIVGMAEYPENTIPTTNPVPIDASTKSHIYYFQYWGYQEVASGGGTQIYWPIEEPSFGSIGLALRGSGICIVSVIVARAMAWLAGRMCVSTMTMVLSTAKFGLTI